MTKRPSFLMLIATSSFEMDDRLRKECESIRDHLGDVSVVGFESEVSKARRGEISPGVPFTGLAHHSKARFRPGKGLPVKAMETAWRLVLQIVRRRPDVVWLHDPPFWPVVWLSLLLRRIGMINHVVWDLHELIPDSELRGRFSGLIRRCLEGVDLLIMTNQWRAEHLRETLLFEPRHLILLENYPSAEVLTRSSCDLPAEVEKWLRGRPFILGQGAAGQDRNFPQLRAAVETTGIPMVVIGRKPEGLRPDLFYCTGWIPQDEIYPYLNRADLSVILYERGNPNAWFCSPNRLFQAIVRGCPVLGGSNPPIARVLAQFDVGHVVAGDGSNPHELVRGIELALARRDRLRRPAEEVQGEFIWEHQFERALPSIQRALPAGSPAAGSRR